MPRRGFTTINRIGTDHNKGGLNECQPTIIEFGTNGDEKVTSALIGCQANGCGGGDEDHPPPELADGEVPKSDSSISLGIPNSVTLWTSQPRPPHSADVG